MWKERLEQFSQQSPPHESGSADTGSQPDPQPQLPDKPLPFISYRVTSPEDFLSAFKINVLGPALLFKTLLPILERGSRKVIVNLSTRVGSISCAKEEFGDFCATYASCKAALNMFVSTLMRNLTSQI